MLLYLIDVCGVLFAWVVYCVVLVFDFLFWVVVLVIGLDLVDWCLIYFGLVYDSYCGFWDLRVGLFYAGYEIFLMGVMVWVSVCELPVVVFIV